MYDNTAILDPTGCPKWTVDTFGGDAGGDSGGKDHIWRYYDPNSVTFNGCLAVGKPATRELVKVGDNYQYKVKLYNAGNNDFSTVQIQDTLPSGVTYISAVPAPSNVSLPNLTWTVAPFLRSQMFEATVTVKASGSGPLNNNVCAAGTPALGGPIDQQLRQGHHGLGQPAAAAPEQERHARPRWRRAARCTTRSTSSTSAAVPPAARW